MTDIFSVSPLAFLIFPVFYWATLRWKRINLLILFAFSILIYSWGHFDRGLLLLLLTVIDFLLVRYIYPLQRIRKTAFISGILLNVVVWLFFKQNLQNIFITNPFSSPLGISFYMLRKISFLIDNFQNPEDIDINFVEYGICVSFFPQLLSGPIERPAAFVKKIRRETKIDLPKIAAAGKLIIFGLVKKIIVADNLRLIVDRIFQLNHPSRLLAMLGILGFSIQLFCDFSGYTDISRGAAYLLGIETAENFNKPYLSTSPSEFWRRWHITFSNWLQTYIFNPIRRFCLKRWTHSSFVCELIPPLVTMVFSGFWHGNGILFIVWGIYHGFIIYIYRVLKLESKHENLKGGNLLSRWLLTYSLIQIGWIFFRAPSLVWIYDLVTSSSWGFSGSQFTVSLSLISMIAMYTLPIILFRIIEKGSRVRPFTEPIFYAVAVIVLIIFSGSGVQEFVYTGF